MLRSINIYRPFQSWWVSRLGRWVVCRQPPGLVWRGLQYYQTTLQDWDHQIPRGDFQRNHWDLADLPREDCRRGGANHPPLLPHWCRLHSAGRFLRGLWGDRDPGRPTRVVHSQPAEKTLANIKQNAGNINKGQHQIKNIPCWGHSLKEKFTSFP